MVITLIGNRATGKSTVGSALAQRLGCEFFDIDDEIVRRAGKPINRIFAEDGEPHFRAIEFAVLADQLARSHVVIGTGGGTVLADANRAAMRAAGPVVWLQSSVETIIARMKADPRSAATRPSLTGADPFEEVPIVLARRTPFYTEAATITVNTENRTPAGIVDDILAQLPRNPGNAQ